MSRTLRSAALAVLVLRPISAAAVPPDTLVFGTTTKDHYINAAECSSSTATVQLNGTITLNGTIAYSAGGTYNVYASTAAPTQDGTSGSWICPASTTNLIASGLTASSATTAILPPITVKLSDIVAKATLTCQSADQTIWVCVHWFDPLQTSQSRGSAWGQIQLQVQAPGQPVINSVAPDDSSLQVSWSAPGTSNGEALASYYHIHADTTDARDPTQNHETGDLPGTSGSIGGLVNNVPYDITVVAYSVGGNPGQASAAVTGTPVPTQSFWGYYKLQGGREQGGCSTAGGGLLALAGVAFALRRRRS